MNHAPLAVRALSQAPQTLTLAEALGLVIDPHEGLPIARRLLTALGGEGAALDALAERAEIGEYALPPVEGLDPPARARVLAAIALGRQLQERREALRLRRPIRGERAFAESLARVPEALRFETREWIGVVICGIQGWQPLQLVARGSRTHVNLSPSELFRPLLAQRAPAFGLYHNHPSGRCLPSATDIQLTELVMDLSEQLGIRFLGHGIVGPGSEHWIDGPAFRRARDGLGPLSRSVP